VILILLALDVLFTLGFAAVVSGRSRQDYDIPFLGAAANHLYNRLDLSQQNWHGMVWLYNMLSCLLHPALLFMNRDLSLHVIIVFKILFNKLSSNFYVVQLMQFWF
jgi:hypothetical protein